VTRHQNTIAVDEILPTKRVQVHPRKIGGRLVARVVEEEVVELLQLRQRLQRPRRLDEVQRRHRHAEVLESWRR
jgi:hypothetical protein